LHLENDSPFPPFCCERFLCSFFPPVFSRPIQSMNFVTTLCISRIRPQLKIDEMKGATIVLSSPPFSFGFLRPFSPKSPRSLPCRRSFLYSSSVFPSASPARIPEIFDDRSNSSIRLPPSRYLQYFLTSTLLPLLFPPPGALMMVKTSSPLSLPSLLRTVSFAKGDSSRARPRYIPFPVHPPLSPLTISRTCIYRPPCPLSLLKQSPSSTSTHCYNPGFCFPCHLSCKVPPPLKTSSRSFRLQVLQEVHPFLEKIGPLLFRQRVFPLHSFDRLIPFRVTTASSLPLLPHINLFYLNSFSLTSDHSHSLLYSEACFESFEPSGGSTPVLANPCLFLPFPHLPLQSILPPLCLAQ